MGARELGWTIWTKQGDSYSASTWWDIKVHYADDLAPTTALVNITNMIWDGDSYNSTKGPRSILPNVTQCSISWYNQTYASSHVESGTLDDAPTSKTILDIYPFGDTFTEETQTDFYVAYTDHKPVSKAEAHNWTYDPALAPSDIYFVNDIDLDSLEDLFTSVFSELYFSGGANFFDQMSINANLTQSQWSSLLELIPSGTLLETSQSNDVDWAQEIFVFAHNGNISTTLDNVAASLTRLLRQGPNSTSVSGTVKRPILFIRIDWPWFIYPVMLSVFSVVFLTIAIVLSHGPGKLVWKASSLAVAFHGLRSTDDFERTVLAKDMERLARKQRAQLSMDEAGRIALRSS
ncbi:hypothetical protein LTR08_002991 [Meristemomyces frigidus]|nr:hypothetical protein LTR08_002991 [Meristemomyces frigidus]